MIRLEELKISIYSFITHFKAFVVEAHESNHYVIVDIF